MTLPLFFTGYVKFRSAVFIIYFLTGLPLTDRFRKSLTHDFNITAASVTLL